MSEALKAFIIFCFTALAIYFDKWWIVFFSIVVVIGCGEVRKSVDVLQDTPKEKGDSNSDGVL